MKNSKKFILFSVVAVLFFSNNVFAHPGRTDSSGGHKDNKNASGLGNYHYHHGYSAHLHPNGICPYASSTSITPDVPKLSAPINIYTESTPNSITFTWSPMVDATSYVVSVNGDVKTTTETTITYTGLIPNQIYEYTIKSKNSNTESAPSDVYTEKTKPKQIQKEIIVKVNNKTILFDQPPEMINNQVVIPVRDIVEELGCAVEWEDKTETIYINTIDVPVSKIAVKTDNINIYLNNKIVKFNVQQPININGVIFIPIRPVVTELGYNVEWDQLTQTVFINKID